MRLIHFLLLLTFISCQPKKPPVYDWQMYRGVNAGVNLTEEDVKDAAALGINLIRLSFPSHPLMHIEPPYYFDEEAFAYLDSVLHWCEKYQIGVVIDPHRYPGTEHQWTMLGSDPFWKDFAWHNHALRLWGEIAHRYHDKGSVIAGYDLLNEPAPPEDTAEGTPADLNLIYQKMIDTIRYHDRQHAIILASPRIQTEAGGSYIQGLSKLKLPEDDNLVVEIHVYEPMAFSHQNVWDSTVALVQYPGQINGALWNKEKIEKLFQSAVAFMEQHNIPLFVGEFSSPRWTGKMGSEYLEDIIQICEESRIAWTYHAYREASIWDPEKSNIDREDDERKSSTPRLEMLKSYFARNPAR